VLTLVVIVITANHYVIDAVGGSVISADRLVSRQPVHARRPTGTARRARNAGVRP
jgi:hypothetical protein